MTKAASSRRAELLLTTALLAMIAVPAAGQNLPTGASFPGQTADLQPGANALTVRLRSGRTAINWTSFDVGNGFTVHFDGGYFGGGATAVLNRVTGATQSSILGTLNSDPVIDVFLVNPNGILFGSTAQVDVGSLFASTLNITDADFLDSGDLNFVGSVSTGVSVGGGATLLARQGDIALLGAQINVDPGTQVRAPNGTVFLAAANGSRINVQLNNYFTTAGSPVASLTVGGSVSGKDIVVSASQANITNALLQISGDVTATSVAGAGGDIVLVSDDALQVTSSGRVTASGRATLVADGSLSNAGSITSVGAFFGEGGDILNSGSITAANGDVFLESDSGELINQDGATIRSGRDIELLSADDLSNDGIVTADRDALVETDSAVVGNGTIEGRDVTTDGFTPSVFSMGTINARDDVLIRSAGDVNVGSITAGTSVGTLGPVDEAGAADDIAADEGIDLTGHDVDIDADFITAQAISALGLGSDIHLWTDVSAQVEFDIETSDYFLDDLNFRAGGNITIDGSAQATDVAMVAGGSLTVRDVSALDDIVLKAGGTLSPGIVQTGLSIAETFAPIDQFGAVDAEEGATLVGHDIILSSPNMRLSDVTATGVGSDIATTGAATSLTTGGDVNFTAGGSIDNGASITTGGFVQLVAAGNVSNRGTITAGSTKPLDTDSDVFIEAGGDFNNSGAITAPDMRFDAVNITNSGTLRGGVGAIPDDFTDIWFNATGAVVNSGVLSGLDFVELKGASVTNSGPITVGLNITPDYLEDIWFRSDGSIVNSGTLVAGDVVRFDGVDITNTGNITAGVSIPANGTRDIAFNGSGNIVNSGVLTAGDIIRLNGAGVTNSGAISAREIDLITSAGDVTNSGALSAQGDISVVANDGDLTNSGTVDSSDGDVILYAWNGDLNNSASVAGGYVDVEADGDIANSGNLTSASDMLIESYEGDVVNSAALSADGIEIDADDGDLSNSGSIISTDFVLLRADGNVSNQGTIQAGDDVKILAGNNILDPTSNRSSSISGLDIGLTAGGSVTQGTLTARDDIAIDAGGTVTTDSLTSGATISGDGPADIFGAADSVLDATLTGHDIDIAGSSIAAGHVSASGADSDIILRGPVTASRTDLDFSTDGSLTLTGALNANAGKVSILADDLNLQSTLSGGQVTITNRAGGSGRTVLGDFPVIGTGATAIDDFTLTSAELNRIITPVLTIDSLGQNLLIGSWAINNATGSTRVNLLGTGRVDLVGLLSASGLGRTLQLGGTSGTANAGSAATLASVIRIAPTLGAGGRILFDDGILDLRGAKIGVGLDDGFLTPLGLLAGGAPVSTSVVAKDWVANRKSTLYGVPGGYSNPTVISTGTLRVTYADYALFQNTAAPGSMPTGVNADALEIASSGKSGQNSFALFGTIDDADGIGAALVVKPDDVSYGNSRVNGCLIVTGGGCGGGTSDLPFPLNVVDAAEAGSSDAAAQGIGVSALATQKLVGTDEERTFDFESLVGTNNEGLLGALGTEKPPVTDRCTSERPDETCRVGEKPNDQ